MADTRIFRHPKRPEWGLAMITEWLEDRVRFVFEDAQIRAFKSDSLNVLEVVDVLEPDATALRARLQRKVPSATRKTTGVRKPAKPSKPSKVVKVAPSEP